ncbi:kinase [Chlorella sorokiniana]|uniref:Kinase n=1 Tax=Chlorella sorokiniana TaxID=3076 RepID=A0A2P6TM77_CHLSO|nr:kinase [Chlorella sorokiniana]|eukprot:PRW45442.1 kinase [Chlorella sorokiniana]
MGRQPRLLLLAATLFCLAAAARGDTYTVVWGQEDLLRALALAAASSFNQTIIELPRDIQLEASAAAAYQLPLRLKGQLALRRAQDAEAVHLNLGGIPQLLFLDRGAQLELSNLSVSGIAAADGQLNGLPTQAKGLVLFPAIDAEPGATVKLHNLSLSLPASQLCSGYAAGQPLGAAPVVDGADGVAVGEVLVDASDVSIECAGSAAGGAGSAPAPSNGDNSSGSSGSSGGGTPGWVWAIVAVAVVACVSAALVARCREALRQCRADLDDLKAVCNAATSHKAACAQLLEAGTAAVDALEQLVTAAGSDLERCRAAQQMAARVQGALDQAEALAKTYGRKQLFNRFASEMLSLMTNQVPLKFDSSITELSNLAKKMRHDVLHPPSGESSSQSCRSPGGMLRGSMPTTLTSGSTGMDSRGPSTAYGSLGSNFMGSTVYGSPNSSTLGGSRSASGVVAVRSSGGVGVEAGALYGIGRAAAPTFDAQQQQQRQAGSGSGGPQQLEADAAAAAAVQQAEEAEPPIGRMVISWDELERVQVLSKREEGQVWLGRWQETDVVIRQLRSLEALGLSPEQLQRDESGAIQLDRDALQALDREVGLMQDMRHPHVVLFMGVVLEPPAIVTEQCARGSLRDLLQQARSNAALAAELSWPHRLTMALEAAKGMIYLHGRRPPVAPVGLGSGNLLVNSDWRVKVANFSLSRDAAAALAGKAQDVSAFGLVLLELLTWQPAEVQQGQRPAVPSEQEAAQLPGGSFAAYGDYAALMQRCWAELPEERPSFEQIAAEVRQMLEKTPRAGAANGDQH